MCIAVVSGGGGRSGGQDRAIAPTMSFCNSLKMPLRVLMKKDKFPPAHARFARHTSFPPCELLMFSGKK